MPGNPAAAVISFEMLARPALLRLMGAKDVHEPRFKVRFPFEYKYKPGRVFLLRARVVPDPDGGYRVEPPGAQGSGLLRSLAHANAIIVLPAEGGVVAPGDHMPAQWIGGRP